MQVASESPRRLAAASVKRAPTAARPWTPCPASPAPPDSAATRVSLGSRGVGLGPRVRTGLRLVRRTEVAGGERPAGPPGVCVGQARGSSRPGRPPERERPKSTGRAQMKEGPEQVDTPSVWRLGLKDPQITDCARHRTNEHVGARGPDALENRTRAALCVREARHTALCLQGEMEARGPLGVRGTRQGTGPRPSPYLLCGLPSPPPHPSKLILPRGLSPRFCPRLRGPRLRISPPFPSRDRELPQPALPSGALLSGRDSQPQALPAGSVQEQRTGGGSGRVPAVPCRLLQRPAGPGRLPPLRELCLLSAG